VWQIFGIYIVYRSSDRINKSVIDADIYRHDPYAYYSTELYKDIYPFPILYIVIYGWFLVITYAIKGLFIIAVYAYFKYVGGLDDPNAEESADL